MRQIGIKSGDAGGDGQGGGRQRELKKKGWEMGLPDNHYERQVPALQHPGMVLGIQPPVDGRDQCVQRAQGCRFLFAIIFTFLSEKILLSISMSMLLFPVQRLVFNGSPEQTTT